MPTLAAVTASLNVTVKLTVLAFVSALPDRTIELTVGLVLSMASPD